MFASDSSNAAQRPRTSWLSWVAAILLLLFAFGYFVVKPLAEQALEGAAAVFAGLLGAAAAAVQIPFEMACQQVEQSDEVRALVGAPIECAPIEETEWLEPSDRGELEFSLKFAGPKGTGQAHVVAIPMDTGFELISVDVTGPTGDVTRLLEP